MKSVTRFAVSACAIAGCAGAAAAATPGVETFSGSLNGWGSNPSIVTLEMGGVDGPADGFAKVLNSFETEMLIRATNSTAPDFTGSYTAAGITQISFALNELEIDEGLGIRFGFGGLGNFWVSNDTFDPEVGVWETFSIDLIESNFTEVFGGSGTFAAAMSNATRVQFRHDLGPAGIMPDLAMGDFGIDNISLIPAPGPVGVLALAGLAAVCRRR